MLFSAEKSGALRASGLRARLGTALVPPAEPLCGCELRDGGVSGFAGFWQSGRDHKKLENALTGKGGSSIIGGKAVQPFYNALRKEANRLDRIELVRQILRECTESSAAVNRFLETPRKYTAEDNLYMREVHFVVAVGPEGSPTMSEMAARLNVTQGAVTQMVTRLEKKGYVVRTKALFDKRQTMVTLTDRGRGLCADHLDFDKSEHLLASEILGEFPDEDLEKFIRFLRLVRVIFTKQ